MNTVVSQAIATGLPVVTTEHSGLPEQIVHGKNGLVVAEGDFKALAEAMLFLMNSPELWAAYGRYGRTHAMQNYDSKELINQQIEFYRKLQEPANPASIPAIGEK